MLVEEEEEEVKEEGESSRDAGCGMGVVTARWVVTATLAMRQAG